MARPILVTGRPKRGHSEFPRRKNLKPFCGAWQGAGASGFFGLSPVCGSTDERDKPDPFLLARSCHQLSAISSPLPHRAMDHVDRMQ